MQKPTVIVSGKDGQLGKALQEVAGLHPQLNILFYSKAELNICNGAALQAVFKKHEPSFFINAAAYTAVDKAETDQENAYLINALAPGLIAEICSRYDASLIHISTDYVFDGKAVTPYEENSFTDPVNYYGFSKWKGESFALDNNLKTIILRTSWVYSEHGNNFVKTMLRLMEERKEINVVSDQFGSPTYAKDLANAILKIMTIDGVLNSTCASSVYGIYHFSNLGIISWYDFALAIKNFKGLDCRINPIGTAQFPTAAKRPAYSGLNKEKIQTVFNIELRRWESSLQESLNNL